MIRCDGSPHGFRAGAATPRSQESGGTPGLRESGGTNSGSWESGVGVPVPEFTVFCQ
ncbi:hypothetical protein PAXRUDRAFT_834352 [Paxillus rubicundulus Ve08.2h10]|uniref:Uncharacterized protein n=1 Tax=Paxillus rubicundulus Ve08.2h10 TaxID=930991 RepID=A0A0D0DL01_9AGAM|nr:hypothetical protein PAXRUDRAFT_834352 [Paxillus rubicundulus Ve08.2h10]